MNFTGVCQHGHQQIDFAQGSRAQNSAQLRQEHFGVGQAPTNGSQAQSRVQVRSVVTRFIERLVCTHIDCSNGHWQALHAFDGPPILLKLLVFFWQITLPAHEQKLTSKKPHTDSASQHSSIGIFRHFNVGQEFNFLAI